jgi:hypothetical protein
VIATLVLALAANPALAQGGDAAPTPTPAQTLIVCAPGYPGNTAAAQPTMDLFAKIACAAASWPASTLGAVYYETAAAGVQRLHGEDAVLALLSLPFFLQHEKDLDLRARLQVAQDQDALETWSLAVRRGTAPFPAALDGWEITGLAGYAPEFVRGPVLGAWGSPPASARVTFTANVLSALRRAAAGESLGVVLDGAQAKALATLPFGQDLEIVARSRPLPGAILCTVGRRLTSRQAEGITRGLQRLHTRPEGAEILKTLRLARFDAVDEAALEAARRACAAAGSGPLSRPTGSPADSGPGGSAP